MYWKKWLLMILFAGLILPALASAENDSTTYMVKKGDTLWGISERFIKDPYYWPSLWSNNPFITNPHLIYPGQKLYIYDGKIHVVPKQAETPESDVVPPEQELVAMPLPEPQEVITISTFGGSGGFIGMEDLPAVGRILDTVDNRLLMAAGDTVFVELNDLRGYMPGDALSIYRKEPGEILHPATGQPFGFRVSQVGTLVITAINEQVATASITTSNREVHRTDLLLPFTPPVTEVELKKASLETRGYLVDARGGQIGLGQHDIIFLDLGSEAGVEVGNVVNITRPRKPSEFIVDQTDLKLPDILVGAAVIVETRPKTSAALVIKSADALFRGDWVTTVRE